MDRIPSSPPNIPARAAVENRPLWSVMIPVYNCARYLPDTLESVLEQDLGEERMQIEVIDDASTDDDVEKMVRELGKGRVGYYRQAHNVGSLRNFETCINRANGQFVHLLHGDDRVKNGFYKKLSALFYTYPEAGAACCNYDFIDDSGGVSHSNQMEATQEGILENWLARIAERQRLQYVAVAVRREVYEVLGSFYGATYGEDWEMWTRIAKYYPIAYTPQVLAQYRQHNDSITSGKILSGEIYSDLTFVINQISHHLPKASRDRIAKRSRFDLALFMLGMAYKSWEDSRCYSSIRIYLRQILKLSKHPKVICHIINIYYKVLSDLLRKVSINDFSKTYLAKKTRSYQKDGRR